LSYAKGSPELSVDAGSITLNAPFSPHVVFYVLNADFNPHIYRAAWHVSVCLSSAAFLIAWRDLPFSKEIHDTYSHGCHGSALSDWIDRTGPIASPPL
jgi:hypothetical protein